MKIGVFDSGLGGTSVLKEIKTILPNEEYKYIADSKNCPYGEKSDEELKAIVAKNTEELKEWGAKIIVIACNTATTKCINYLREKYPELEFVGTEPAIKLAANTNVKNILVMATPGTIASERTKMLLKEYQKDNQKITLLACPGLADTVEDNLLAPDTDHRSAIKIKLSELLSTQPEPDTVVLGCTHYSLIKPEIQSFFPSATLVDGNKGVAHRVKDLVEKYKI